MQLTDATGYTVSIPQAPQRIVSLVPSLTEYVVDLCSLNRLAGCTRFCVHPADARRMATVVGGTKDATTARILTLKPDLVVANMEENPKPLVEQLRAHTAVFTTRIESVPEAFKNLRSLGQALHEQQETDLLVSQLEEKWANLTKAKEQFSKKLRVLYLIWKGPWMAAGHGTYIHAVLSHLGLENALPSDAGRYPALSRDQLVNLQADLILLSSEPFPFREQHAKSLQDELSTRTLCVNGEWFSWYGSRMGPSADALLAWQAKLARRF